MRRSTTVPHLDEEIGGVGERAARGEDGKTYYVPDNITYPEWKEKFVDGGDKEGLTEVDKSGESGRIIAKGSKMKVNAIENELEYGVPYGKYSLNADMEYKNSEKYANKFKNITDNEMVNQTLLECSRAAITHRNGTLYEDMYLINGCRRTQWTNIQISEQSGVC